MTLYRVEVEKRLQVTFYIEAENKDVAGEQAGEVAEGIDDLDWDDWHGWDFDVKEIVRDETVPDYGAYSRGSKHLMNAAALEKDAKEKGIWVGGPGGTWEYDFEYLKPKPPKPDPNQGSLLDTGGDIDPDKAAREIEETPGL